MNALHLPADTQGLITLIMAAAVALAVGMYVILDGFDLGLGVLFPFTDDETQRDRIMASIAPFWDGNETWLVFGGALMAAMFPAAFAVILPAVYLPIIVMLLAVVFRGVAFEFRFKDTPRRLVWDLSFCGGSLLATLAQGIVPGTFVQGIPVVDGRYAGGGWNWLTPISLLTGLALVAGYALLGAAWLHWRGGPVLRAKASRWVPWLLAGLLTAIGAVSVWTPLMSATIAERWFDFPDALALAPVPVLTAGCSWGLLRSLRRSTPSDWPFAFGLGLFFLSYTGLAISIFPMLLPPSMSLFDAAASSSSQRFLLPGVLVLVPFILLRTWLNYRMFASRDDEDAGFSHS